MPTDTVTASQQLAGFLRSRRERLDPRDFSLPAQRRARRTPGLRREEVAELAGVSTDYLVRLEQGRDLRPSAEVVEALARALRLQPEERAYLFDLAQQRPRTADEPARTASPELTQLIDDLSPLPAMLLNHRYDILAWNEQMAELMVDFGALPSAQRNSMWLCLMHPGLRDFYVDRERVVREGIAHLRTAWAAHSDDVRLTALIDEFLDGNEDFARLWAQQDVKVGGRARKVLRHRRLGLLTVEFEVLVPLQDPDQRLLVCRGADDESRAVLARLAGRLAGDVTPDEAAVSS